MSKVVATGGRRWQGLAVALVLALVACQTGPSAEAPGRASAPASGAASAPGGSQAAPAGAAEPTRIVFALPGRQLFQLSPLLAEDKGLFRDEGIQATVIELGNRERRGGLLSGEGEQDRGGGSTLFRAARTGEAKAAMFVHGLAPWRVIGQPDVRSAADLRGARVMVSNPGSAGNLLARTALRRAGLDPDRDLDIIIALSESARLAAVETGQVKAANVAVPFDVMLMRRGYTVIADGLEMGLDLPITGVVATPAKLANRPDEVRRVLRAFLRVQQFIRENRAETVEFAARAFEVAPDLGDSELDRLVRTDAPSGELTDAQLRRFFELNQAEGVDLEVRIEDVRFNNLCDYTSLRQARTELGF